MRLLLTALLLTLDHAAHAAAPTSGFTRESAMGAAIEALSFHDGKTLAVSTVTARLALQTDYVLVTLEAVGCNMHLKFGDVTAVAAATDLAWDVYLSDGGAIDVPLRPGVTHVAAIGDAVACVLKSSGRK